MENVETLTILDNVVTSLEYVFLLKVKRQVSLRVTI